MNVRQWIALILILPVATIFWIVTGFEILFYPYTAMVTTLANGRWMPFHEYLYEVIGRPFGG